MILLTRITIGVRGLTLGWSGLVRLLWLCFGLFFCLGKLLLYLGDFLFGGLRSLLRCGHGIAALRRALALAD